MIGRGNHPSLFISAAIAGLFLLVQLGHGPASAQPRPSPVPAETSTKNAGADVDLLPLSLGLCPGLTIPVGEGAGSYSLGASGALAAEYVFPSLRLLFLRGELEYDLGVLRAGPTISHMSLAAGAGVRWGLLPWLDLRAFVAGGFYYGFLNAATPFVGGGDPYLSTGAAAVLRISPAFSIRAGASYNHSFELTLPPTSPIVQGGSATFTIQFTPASIGTKSATVGIANSDPDEGSYSFAISGAGTAVPTPEINIKGPDAQPIADGGGPFSFLPTLVGENRAATFTIENMGSGDVYLGGNPRVQIEGSDAAHFDLSVVPDPLIAPSGSTTFTLRFAPESGGAKSATVIISNNDPDENPYNFSVEGFAGVVPEMNVTQGDTDIADDTGSHDFAATPLGSFPDVVFSVENLGTGNLTLSGSPTVQLSDDSEFQVTVQAASPVAPSSSATFTIHFAPTSLGSKSATVSIANDDPDENPYQFLVTGVGTTPLRKVRGMWMIGGLTSGDIGTAVAPVDLYDPVTDTWYGTVTTLPTPVSFAAAESWGGKIYVIGGFSSSGVVQDKVQIYDVDADSWSVGTAMPIAKANIHASVVNGKIYVLGGTTGAAAAMWAGSTTTYEYTPDSTWSLKSGFSASRMSERMSLAFDGGDVIYHLGGRTAAAVPDPSHDGFDVASNAATTVTEVVLAPARTGPAGVLYEPASGPAVIALAGGVTALIGTTGSFVVQGTVTATMTDRFEYLESPFTSPSSAWTSGAAVYPLLVGFPAAALHGSRMYVFGGTGALTSGAASGVTNVYWFDLAAPSSGDWTASTSMDTGRYGHVAVKLRQ